MTCSWHQKSTNSPTHEFINLPIHEFTNSKCGKMFLIAFQMKKRLKMFFKVINKKWYTIKKRFNRLYGLFAALYIHDWWIVEFVVSFFWCHEQVRGLRLFLVFKYLVSLWFNGEGLKRPRDFQRTVAILLKVKNQVFPRGKPHQKEKPHLVIGNK